MNRIMFFHMIIFTSTEALKSHSCSDSIDMPVLQVWHFVSSLNGMRWISTEWFWYVDLKNSAFYYFCGLVWCFLSNKIICRFGTTWGFFNFGSVSINHFCQTKQALIKFQCDWITSKISVSTNDKIIWGN